MQAHESPIPPFELAITIKPSDIDELGHVNNVVYLSWVQDVAIAHWNFLTTHAHRAKYVWVALRHEIDYKAEAVLGMPSLPGHGQEWDAACVFPDIRR